MSSIEDKIIECLERIDERRKQAAGVKREAADGKKHLEQQQGQVEKDLAQSREREKVLGAERDGIIPQFDPEALEVYGRALRRRQDSAMAPAANYTCQACNMRLTPQEFNLILMGEEIVRCNNCTRILYTDETI